MGLAPDRVLPRRIVSALRDILPHSLAEEDFDHHRGDCGFIAPVNPNALAVWREQTSRNRLLASSK
jgi:hypothetical protein